MRSGIRDPVRVADEDQDGATDLRGPVEDLALRLGNGGEPAQGHGGEDSRVFGVGADDLRVVAQPGRLEPTLDGERRQHTGGERQARPLEKGDHQGRREEGAADRQRLEGLRMEAYEIEGDQTAQAVADQPQRGRRRRDLPDLFQEELEIRAVVREAPHVPPRPLGVAMPAQVGEVALVPRRDQLRHELPIAPPVLGIAVDDHQAAAALRQEMMLAGQRQPVGSPRLREHDLGVHGHVIPGSPSAPPGDSGCRASRCRRSRGWSPSIARRCRGRAG